MADTSFKIASEKLQVAQITPLTQFFLTFEFVRIYGHGVYEVSRMLIRNNVNNNVNNDSPIATDRNVYGTTQKVIIVDCKSLVCLLFPFSLSKLKWASDKLSFLARPSIFIMPALRSFGCIRVFVCQLKSSVLI